MALFEAFGRSNWIQMAATTGTASVKIGGSTVHATLKIAISKKNTTEEADVEDSRKGGKASDTIKKCKFIIIDEVSMMDCQLATSVNEQLKRAKGYPKAGKDKEDLDWGGIHIIFAGKIFCTPFCYHF